MQLSRVRDGREAIVFVLLTPVLAFMSISLERSDPDVPGKFAFLVLLIPTVIVALTGRRWQGLITALISGLGCVVAGCMGNTVPLALLPGNLMGMPVLLGGTLIAVGALLTLRRDDVEQRIGELEAGVERIVSASDLNSVVASILDTAARLAPGEGCELHVWEPSEQAFVRLRRAIYCPDTRSLTVWDPDTKLADGAVDMAVSPPNQRIPLFSGGNDDTRAPNVTDWQSLMTQMGGWSRGDLPVPLISGDDEVLGYLRIVVRQADLADIQPLLRILTSFSGLALRNVRLIERLRDQAGRDTLTGLWNYAAFQDELRVALSRGSSSTALVLMDLDKFKEVNDQHGHQLGSMLLRHLSDTWRSILPAGAVLARYGGDEFACVLPFADREHVLEHLETLRQLLAERPIVSRAVEIHAQPSIGVAFCPDDAQTAEEIFQRADQALYAAKRLGGGTTCLAGDADVVNEVLEPVGSL
jgi:diguanylate cyclase (GGDEF)-like protein